MPCPVFESPPAKLTIASIDTPEIQVQAQYNPRELQLDKQVAWGQHNRLDNRAWWKRSGKQQSDLEFTGADGRTLTLELLFDGYESGKSVEPIVEQLEELASVRDPSSSREDDRRPPLCLVTWGPSGDATAAVGGMRPFRCVIESLSVKYTMFSATGTPLRAVCNVKLKESYALSVNFKPAAVAKPAR